jgi:citrate lyase beta subunit
MAGCGRPVGRAKQATAEQRSVRAPSLGPGKPQPLPAPPADRLRRADLDRCYGPRSGAAHASATTSNLQLLLFSTDSDQVRAAADGGIAGVVVDWERIGKEGRQRSADTQISHDTVEDLVRVRAATSLPVICRVDSCPSALDRQIGEALTEGADEILLPMVRSVREVERILDRVGSRAGVGILIETVEAVALAAPLGQLPLARVYVGLNDLAIARGAASIFAAILDGTVERVRRQVTIPFGFGGLTLPNRGAPVPCRLLLGEMARLACDFSFLRRAFRRDAQGVGPAEAAREIARAFRQAQRRNVVEVQRDHVMLEAAILASLSREPLGAGSVSERTA